MAYKIDYWDGDVLEWTIGNGGVEMRRVTDYTPSIYVAGEDLGELRGYMRRRPRIEGTEWERWRTRWRDGPERVLRVDLCGPDVVRSVAREIRGYGGPGRYRLYNVDLTREYRYCLDRDVDPCPEDYSTLRIEVPKKHLNDGRLTAAKIDGETYRAGEETLLRAVKEELRENDPDILILSHSGVVPLLYRKAEEHDVEFRLGRLSGFEELAGQSSYESFGRVGNSPARYNVPGRAIIDLSNSFFWSHTNVAGLFDLVRRSRKPIQELSWASIGNVFTSIQIRTAMEEGVLVPWKSWRHEWFKSMRTLHESDRGGYIFSPEVGVHRGVYEVDFGSLYPNIIVNKNVSPDKILCDCHSDRSDVPELGYNICDEEGFLPRVLRPLVRDRAEMKRMIASGDYPEEEEDLRSKVNALKWVLVSCFGYQGFSNAKFGRIECHEAINAYARDILLETKEIFERHGWRVVHGIIDSMWVMPPGPASERRTRELREICLEVSEEIGVDLEFERLYSWIAFVPRRNDSAGALNRYFGKGRDGDYKFRGIEVRQRSSPDYVRECQREFVEALDSSMDARRVCEALEERLEELRSGDVDPDRLVVRRRVSKELGEYSQRTRSVAALERARMLDFTVYPGEDLPFVVVDDSKEGCGRVRLDFEEVERYDEEYYADQLVRAAESVLSPLGWKEDRIRGYLRDTRDTTLSSFC